MRKLWSVHDGDDDRGGGGHHVDGSDGDDAAVQEKRCFQLPSADLDSTTLEKCSTQLGAPKCRLNCHIHLKIT